ncbi:MAG: hypothetical protein ACTSVC_08865 [Promethearchaeota archaeon]
MSDINTKTEFDIDGLMVEEIDVRDGILLYLKNKEKIVKSLFFP